MEAAAAAAGDPQVLAVLGPSRSAEVAEAVQDAWLSRASARRGRDFLASLEGLTTHPVFVVPGRE